MLGILAMLVTGLLVVAAAPSASADTTYIYWTTNNDTWAGRATIDGTSPNYGFFNTGGPSSGIVIDNQRIYWSADLSGFTGHTIGTVSIDGTGANQSAIDTTAVPYGIAIDATHIYWANHWTGSIGRANLDGTGANPSFITGITEPQAVAVDGNYVYWTSFGPSPYNGTGKIGRANLDGTGANLSFITGASNPQGIALSSTHIYWTNGLGGIGRASLDGTGANQAFISAFGGPAGIVVTSTKIYWAEVTTFRIVSANLDGSGAAILVNLSVTPTSPYGAQPWGLAVHTVPSPILPTLSLTAPATAVAGQSVSLDGVTVGGSTAGQSFTLDMDVAGAGGASNLGSVSATAFPLALHPSWTPSTAGSYTVTLNLRDAGNAVVASTSQVISVSAAPAPTPAPDPAPAPAPTVAPIVPSIVAPAASDAEAAARATQRLVIVKFAVQKNGKVKVVGGKSSWLPGHHAYFTNVTTDPRLVSPTMVRYARSLARQYGGVYGGIVVGYKWHFPRIVAAYFD